MGTNKNVVVSFSIAILLLLSLLLLLTYNSKCNQSHGGPMMQSSQTSNHLGNYSKTPEPFYFEQFTQAQPPVIPSVPTQKDKFISGEGMTVEGMSREGMTVEGMSDLASVKMSNEVSPQWSNRANQAMSQNQNSRAESSMGIAGSSNGDSSFQPVSNMGGGGSGSYSSFGSSDQAAQSCFPRDRLTADDLLPKDAADSKWAKINPSGSGNISDQNYLTAGYHVGVNTVGQSLRNANLQLRSEIPNPQNAVGPWMISTIEPDLRQNTLEIGSSISY
jgi:hypothetical protein